jgi:hypothetical protein
MCCALIVERSVRSLFPSLVVNWCDRGFSTASTLELSGGGAVRLDEWLGAARWIQLNDAVSRLAKIFLLNVE